MLISQLKVGLLFYTVGTENIYVILMNQDGKIKKFNLISCAEAFPLIDQLNNALVGAISSTIRKMAIIDNFCKNWGKQLLPPEEYLDPYDILVFVPHSILHNLPFHLIYSDNKNEYLATAYGITYSPSAALFIRCVDRNPIRAKDISKWELIGDHSIPNNAPEPPKSCIGISTDIKFNKTKEFNDLVNNFSGKFEKNFTTQCRSHLKAKMNNKSQECEVLCFACHGHYNEIDTSNSGLLLEKDNLGISNTTRILHGDIPYFFRDLPLISFPLNIKENINKDVEILTINELNVDVKTNAQLVALFACNTNMGQITVGDYYDSLSTQWLKIGASSVLANLWELDINFISKWNTLFLSNWLEKRQPKAIACKEATKEYLNQNPDCPIYIWGATALFGDWL